MLEISTVPTYLSRQEIARAIGLSRQALYKRKYGGLPEPDAWLAGQPGWSLETVRAWAERNNYVVNDENLPETPR